MDIKWNPITEEMLDGKHGGFPFTECDVYITIESDCGKRDVYPAQLRVERYTRDGIQYAWYDTRSNTRIMSKCDNRVKAWMYNRFPRPYEE